MAYFHEVLAHVSDQSEPINFEIPIDDNRLEQAQYCVSICKPPAFGPGQRRLQQVLHK
jgi:hypothetical protein